MCEHRDPKLSLSLLSSHPGCGVDVLRDSTYTRRSRKDVPLTPEGPGPWARVAHRVEEPGGEVVPHEERRRRVCERQRVRETHGVEEHALEVDEDHHQHEELKPKLHELEEDLVPKVSTHKGRARAVR